MKIAVDLDKTYLDHPEMFNRIIRRLQGAGHSVGILTSRGIYEAVKVGFFPDFSFYLDIGEMDYGGRAVRKAQKMRAEGIDFIFDDHADYFPADVVALHIIQEPPKKT